MIVFGSIWLDLLAVVITVIALLLSFIKWRYLYWSRIGVDYLEPILPYGNFWDTCTQKITIGEELENFYAKMKVKGLKYVGLYFFHLPVFVPVDLDLVKHIMQNDFGHFVDRGVYHNEKVDPLSAHLFSLEGTKWKNLRAKLTPTFTSGKMKMMFPLVVKTSNEIIPVLDGYSADEAVEFKDVLGRLTTDIIGTCAFGLDCNSLRDPDTAFRIYGKLFFRNIGWARLVQFLCFLFPNFMKLIQMRLTPKNLSDFFMGVVHDTVKYREENNIKRNDFMQLLIQMKTNAKISDDTSSNSKLTMDEISAQAFVFFIAGFETSSTTMAFCLYEVAQNQSIQEKMRDEINSVLNKHGGEFTYEAMLEMHYMESVINETLRKYPPLSIINRTCTRDYKIPGTDVVIPKGIRLFIPCQGIQHDPEYYPDPMVFDPSRFSDENKRDRHPFAFFPFGEGPRICIGLRFGMMQTIVGLTILLKNYKFRLSSRTPVPLVLDTEALINGAAGGIWINIEKIAEK